MEEQVNLIFNFPSKNKRATLISDPNLDYYSFNVIEWDSPGYLTHKTIIDDSNIISSTGIQIGGQNINVDSTGANPGDVLTYMGNNLKFIPSSGTGNVISVNGLTGVVSLAPVNIGLGNVNNTSDLNKPVSIPMQNALNNKLNLSDIGTLVPSLGGDGTVPLSQLPGSFTTGLIWKGAWNVALNIPAIPAASPGNNSWYYKVSIPGNSNITGTTVSWQIGDWLISNGTSWERIQNSQNVNSVNGYIGVVNLVPNDIGLGNVNNTSDLNKPISTAMQNALNLKFDKSSVIDNLVTGDPSLALSANQGTILQSNKINYSDIVDNLSTNNPLRPLSANQGVILQSTKFNKSDVVDNTVTQSSTQALSANQGYVLNSLVMQKSNIADIVNNLVTNNPNFPLSAEQGYILQNTKIDIANIADTLTSTDPNMVLSANQGQILNAGKINYSDIVNNLNTNNPNVPLSATQGYLLNNLLMSKVNYSDIVNNLTTNNSSVPLSAAQGYTLQNTKINTSSIANNLTTSDPTMVLSALQGSLLSTLKIDKASIANNLTTSDPTMVLSANQGQILGASKVNITDVVNDLITNNPVKVLSAAQGYLLQNAKINYSDIVNNLTTNNPNVPLSASQGMILQNSKVNISSIVNDLTTGGSSNVLAASQGVILQNTKVNVSDIVNNLTTSNPNVPLSANQGFILQSNKLDKTSIANDLVTNDPSRALSAAQGVILQNSKVNVSSIINDLTTGGSSNVLAASQGVILQNTKINVSSIVNDLTTGGSSNVLAAAQGVILQNTKINVSSIVNDLVTGGSTNVLSASQGVILQNTKVNTSSIVNNLTTNDPTMVLSASQGYLLQNNKVNISDIVNNLTTNNPNVPLSASQGYLLQNTKVNVSDIVNNLTTNNPSVPLSASQGYLLGQNVSQLSSGVIYCDNYLSFNDLITDINASASQVITLKSKSSVNLVQTGPGTINKKLVIALDAQLTISGPNTPNATSIRGIWTLSTAYNSGDIVIYKNGLPYSANANIPSNTPFVSGSSGQTWTQLASSSPGTPTTNSWLLSNSYVSGALVNYNGILYMANSSIPSNTPFVVGSSGLTWTQISGSLVFSAGLFCSQGTAFTLGGNIALNSISVISNTFFMNTSVTMNASASSLLNSTFVMQSANYGPLYNNQSYSVLLNGNLHTIQGNVIITSGDNQTYSSIILSAGANGMNILSNKFLASNPSNCSSYSHILSTDVSLNAIRILNNTFNSPIRNYSISLSGSSSAIFIQGNSFDFTGFTTTSNAGSIVVNIVSCAELCMTGNTIKNYPSCGASFTSITSGSVVSGNSFVSGNNIGTVIGPGLYAYTISITSSSDFTVSNNYLQILGQASACILTNSPKSLRGHILGNTMSCLPQSGNNIAYFINMNPSDRDMTLFDNHWSGTFTAIDGPNSIPTDPSVVSSLNSQWSSV